MRAVLQAQINKIDRNDARYRADDATLQVVSSMLRVQSGRRPQHQKQRTAHVHCS